FSIPVGGCRDCRTCRKSSARVAQSQRETVPGECSGHQVRGMQKKSGGPKPAANLEACCVRSELQRDAAEDVATDLVVATQGVGVGGQAAVARERRLLVEHVVHAQRDRKSTRLNSSHVKISYAVFCLKK